MKLYFVDIDLLVSQSLSYPAILLTKSLPVCPVCIPLLMFYIHKFIGYTYALCIKIDFTKRFIFEN